MRSILFVVAALLLVRSASADEPTTLRTARQTYASLVQPTEGQRVEYLTKLVRLRESFTRKDEGVLDAIDAEVIKHPMPASAVTPAAIKRLVGRWQSPRHPYFYHADGTWASDGNTPDDTGGTWRIVGNHFFQNYRGLAPDKGEEIILLTDTDFVYGTAAAHPYYLRRGKVFPWR